jgi:hypothetical protein
VDVGNNSTRNSRFANYLRKLLPSSDYNVMELAAHAVGRLALASGTYTAEYVEFEVKRAFEWLTGDRHEGKRQAAVGFHMNNITVMLMRIISRCWFCVNLPCAPQLSSSNKSISSLIAFSMLFEIPKFVFFGKEIKC